MPQLSGGRSCHEVGRLRVADLLIAATAVAWDYRIATRAVRSFPRIKGLDVVRW